MTRAGTLIAVASLLMVAAISDVVLAQSAPATDVAALKVIHLAALKLIHPKLDFQPTAS